MKEIGKVKIINRDYRIYGHEEMVEKISKISKVLEDTIESIDKIKTE